MQKFKSVQELVSLWGISERRIRALCENGKIKGAYKVGKTWLIPPSATKPVDGRFKRIIEEEDYKFPGLVYTDYFYDDSELNDEEKTLIRCAKLHLECKNQEAVAPLEALYRKSSKEYIKVGAAYLLGFLYSITVKPEKFAEVLTYLKIKALGSSIHKYDYNLMLQNLEFITGNFSFKYLSTDDIEKLSPESIDLVSIFNLALYFARAIKGEQVDNFVPEINCFYSKNITNPISKFYFHCVMAFFYLRKQDFESRSSHIKKAVEIGIQYKLYTLFSKCAIVVGHELIDELKLADSNIADYVMRMHEELTKSNSATNRSQKVGQDFELFKIEHSEILSLISTGLSNQEIANTLNISLSDFQKKLENIYIDLKVEGKKELIQLLKKNFDVKDI